MKHYLISRDGQTPRGLVLSAAGVLALAAECGHGGIVLEGIADALQEGRPFILTTLRGVAPEWYVTPGVPSAFDDPAFSRAVETASRLGRAAKAQARLAKASPTHGEVDLTEELFA